jgi:hypothetical protein
MSAADGAELGTLFEARLVQPVPAAAGPVFVELRLTFDFSGRR